jgi:hypothetical protein
MMALLLSCPMCFGDPNSRQAAAAKAGVLVLLGVVIPVLIAIALIARSWVRRARALDARQTA